MRNVIIWAVFAVVNCVEWVVFGAVINLAGCLFCMNGALWDLPARRRSIVP